MTRIGLGLHSVFAAGDTSRCTGCIIEAPKTGFCINRSDDELYAYVYRVCEAYEPSRAPSLVEFAGGSPLKELYMILELIMVAATSANIALSYRAYQASKVNHLVLEDAYKSTERQFKRWTEAMLEIERLEQKVLELTAPERPFKYTFYATMTDEAGHEVEKWLQAHCDDLYVIDRTDTRLPGDRAALIRFATEDRNLAMMFKLTFGGAA